MAELVAIELYLVKQVLKGRERETTKNKFLKCACVGFPLMTVPIVDPVNRSEVVIVVCAEQGGACDGRRVEGEYGGVESRYKCQGLMNCVLETSMH